MKATSTLAALCLAALSTAAPGQAGPDAGAALECGSVVVDIAGGFVDYQPRYRTAHTPKGVSPRTGCEFGTKRFKPFAEKCPHLLPPPDASGASGTCTVKGAKVRTRPAAAFAGSIITVRKTLKKKKGYRSIRGELRSYPVGP
jgi:hypothetical protein